MSSVMKVYDYSSEIVNGIIASIENQAEKSVAQQIIERFVQAGLTVKVKHIFYDKPWAYYRILCFIKKSAETVIINTKNDLGKDGVVDGMNIQIRITNGNTFEKLDELECSVRKQIINAHDCSYCSAKCEGKRYLFAYQGKDYVKCQFLCSNFRFANICKSSIPSIITIVNGELDKVKA